LHFLHLEKYHFQSSNNKNKEYIHENRKV
jgi:hypothetical protein